jgi:hypothetical protein
MTPRQRKESLSAQSAKGRAQPIEIVRKAGLAVTGVTISSKGDITVATGAPHDGVGTAPNPWDPPAQGSGR